VRVNNTGFTTDASGAPCLYSVDFGGSQTLRTWKLFSVNSGFGWLTLGPNASIWLPNHPRRPLAWGLGDSYMYGTNATHISMAGFNSMCDLLGLEPMPDGIGGSGWLSTGSNAPATRISHKLATLTRTPDYVFFDLGYNDAGGNMTTLAANSTRRSQRFNQRFLARRSSCSDRQRQRERRRT
jgi:hypothetical protein